MAMNMLDYDKKSNNNNHVVGGGSNNNNILRKRRLVVRRRIHQGTVRLGSILKSRLDVQGQSVTVNSRRTTTQDDPSNDEDPLDDPAGFFSPPRSPPSRRKVNYRYHALGNSNNSNHNDANNSIMDCSASLISSSTAETVGTWSSDSSLSGSLGSPESFSSSGGRDSPHSRPGTPPSSPQAQEQQQRERRRRLDLDVICGLHYSFRHTESSPSQPGYYTGEGYYSTVGEYDASSSSAATFLPHGMGTWRSIDGLTFLEGEWIDGNLNPFSMGPAPVAANEGEEEEEDDVSAGETIYEEGGGDCCDSDDDDGEEEEDWSVDARLLGIGAFPTGVDAASSAIGAFPTSSSATNYVDNAHNVIDDNDDDEYNEVVSGMQYLFPPPKEDSEREHEHEHSPPPPREGYYTGQIDVRTNLPHGMGTWRSANGSSLMEGEWTDGVLSLRHDTSYDSLQEKMAGMGISSGSSSSSLGGSPSSLLRRTKSSMGLETILECDSSSVVSEISSYHKSASTGSGGTRSHGRRARI
mmetsp:Transcript_45852/g.96247  ORF Transcript_45852/g.96247 Transcript_45852/m.96247 type:complete len:523 (-) Transcript_45852:45-1613(-)